MTTGAPTHVACCAECGRLLFGQYLFVRTNRFQNFIQEGPRQPFGPDGPCCAYIQGIYSGISSVVPCDSGGRLSIFDARDRGTAQYEWIR